MNKFLLSCLVVLFSFSANAQISHGGKPYDWNEKSVISTDFINLPGIDLETLQREDAVFDQQKDIPWRFGANIPVDLDINNSGKWTTLGNGDRVWRLELKAKGAVSINFVFDQYHLPAGGKVFVYDIDKKQLAGSFTNENAGPENSLGVGLIFSDHIVISYHEPAAVAGLGYLHINNVTHGYRNALQSIQSEAKGPFGSAKACNVNVNCPEGLPYGIQKRSVALIVVGNNGHCSGALINNTSQDQTQYFLTANHCLGNQGNWIFYFNYETPDCDGDGEASINQSVSGATLKAKNAESDFALLEINNPIPDSYNVCYSGWDATDDPTTVVSAYGIHHPAGDVKKICFEDNVPSQTDLSGFVKKVWFVNNWELGVTQGGSSGSPLFNQSGRIIGQLAGGQADCNGLVNNGMYDYYGRFGISWNFGTTPSTRLKDWLDPGNTGILIVPNSCAGSEPTIDASIVKIEGIESPTCHLDPIEPTINILNTGSETITEITLSVIINEISQEDIIWTGTIEPFSFADISLGTLYPLLGSNVLEVEIMEVNGGTDAVIAGNYRVKEYYGFEESQPVSIHITFDNYALETSWRLETEEGAVLAQGVGSSVITSIDENYCLGIGCYKFVITDSHGDGICCGYGNGSYLLKDSQGNILATGGQFGNEESTDFCITTVLESKAREREFISVFPNPTTNVCHLLLGDTANMILSITVTDALGKILIQDTDFDSNTRDWKFYGSDYGAGIYFINIETSLKSLTKRVVVIR